MGRKNKYPAEIKEQAINEYLNGIKGATEIAEELSIDSSTLRSWVKKYNELGDDGLLDKRGKRKQEDQLSNEERLERKVKLLERQLELKERENILLKKVKEIERRRYSPKQNKK
ncbi:helix-turn-helix domain-containing protein [Erysipelothrix sp. P66]|uniref:helix-turn-helix domain-containing protein n=1 Tax=Erysipelothrix sp. P66 TaxID=3141531 RepID=UPI00315CD4F4